MSGASADAIVGLGMLTLLAVAALGDLRARRIDNRISAGLIALWLVHLVLAGQLSTLLPSIGIGLVVLACGILLWRRRILGGGDVKLLAALAVWAGPADTIAFLLVTALAGGALALAWLWHRRIGWALLLPLRTALVGRLPVGRNADTAGQAAGLPYGVAIAAGGGWLWLRLFAA